MLELELDQEELALEEQDEEYEYLDEWIENETQVTGRMNPAEMLAYIQGSRD